MPARTSKCLQAGPGASRRITFTAASTGHLGRDKPAGDPIRSPGGGVAAPAPVPLSRFGSDWLIRDDSSPMAYWQGGSIRATALLARPVDALRFGPPFRAGVLPGGLVFS